MSPLAVPLDRLRAQQGGNMNATDDARGVNYRCMQISDHAAVMRLWRECEGISLRDADSASGIEKYLGRNSGLSFIAEQEAHIVGSIMAGHDGKRGYIQHLAVAVQARNRGVAGRLVALCVDALGAQGIVKSHVHVLANNATGRAFWSSLGWVQRSEIVMYSFINGDNENA
ncbi:MAG: GNAT family N-acetyltransferase [Gammaproteobacteria bacterium]|nr:GNAT family N-acetyltransferase [Gammaproteobacteria bacterium]MDH3447649.1 GNAT family N-acetyltransferase [Gammaproteobacteria bacterium]